jgi:hypothetical protein
MKHAPVIAGVRIGPGKRTIHSLHARLAKNHCTGSNPNIIKPNQQPGFVTE